jgi:hypothetical protein
MPDRRKEDRGGSDRRRERRNEMPLWGYVFAVMGVALLFTAFWNLVYG